MSKIMIYAPLPTIGGTIENVWGTEMRVRTIDSDNKEIVDAAKYDGWSNKPQDIIELIKAKAMQKDNDRMKGQLSSGADKKRIKELEVELAGVLIESAKLESELKHAQDKLAIYELAKDKNGNGKVDYNKRDGKDTLIKLTNDSE